MPVRLLAILYGVAGALVAVGAAVFHLGAGLVTAGLCVALWASLFSPEGDA